MLILGGGPAGMKAAVTAAQRGHRIHLFEKTGKLGGQVNLAEKLPGRAEFGGVTTNLIRELKLADIDAQLNATATKQLVAEIEPDDIIIATGATPRLPDVEVSGINIIDAWSVVRGDASVGNNVVIADWACDWNGLGVAQHLAQQGHYVRLLSGGSVAGESIQGIVRDSWIGELHKLGVEMIPFARFYGAEQSTAFFQHMTSNEAIICEDVDTIVSCFAPQSNRDLDWLLNADNSATIHRVGDAVTPRTVEEAVLEGFKAAWEL